MAKKASKFFFLLFLHSTLTLYASGTLVGFSYDARKKHATSSPKETITFLKENKVSPAQIRVLVADHSLLNSQFNTEVPVHVYLNETEVEKVRNSQIYTTSWIKTHVLTFLPYINITSIIISTSSDNYSVAKKQLPLLLPTLDTIHSVLKSLNLNQRVKVSVAFSLSILRKLDKKHAREIHRIINAIRKYKSLVVVESEIIGELSMGDHFIKLMMETATLAASVNPCTDVPLVLSVKSTVVPCSVEVAEFTAKMMKSIENETQIATTISGLFAEIFVMDESEQNELKREEEQIFHSSHRELLDQDIKIRTSSTKTILHDSINPPTITIPAATPVTNPVTTSATIPSANPTPTIVSVPSTNPVTVVPTNPVMTPITVPFTTPIIVPSTNPVNPPATVPITNPSTIPVPSTTTPITNPVTTYPIPHPGSTTITPPSTVPNVNPVTTYPPIALGNTWCVAKTGTPASALQAALDYACGIGGVDCSAIQQTGSCYNPNTIQSHAAYAFNSYYQKNPLPTSCDFAGAAIIVNRNPSKSLTSLDGSFLLLLPNIRPLTSGDGNRTSHKLYNTDSLEKSTGTGSACIYPSAAAATAAAASSSSSPSMLNTSNPATTTTTIFGSELPPNSITSVSISARPQPFLLSILLVTSLVIGQLMMYM